MNNRKLIILMIALISIVCISLSACNATPQISYEKVKLTPENIREYLSFQVYTDGSHYNDFAVYETSKKLNAQFEGVYFSYTASYGHKGKVDVDWEGNSKFTYEIGNSVTEFEITITEVQGYVLIPN